MEKPNEKMNTQTRLAEDYRGQLNRFRALLAYTPKAASSAQTTPSVAPISTQAFGGLLMVAQTEEEARSYILANPVAATRFLQAAVMWDGVAAPYPPEQFRAVVEANHPFLILGQLNGGDPRKSA
jgi:hypothetical protein